MDKHTTLRERLPHATECFPDHCPQIRSLSLSEHSTRVWEPCHKRAVSMKVPQKILSVLRARRFNPEMDLIKPLPVKSTVPASTSPMCAPSPQTDWTNFDPVKSIFDLFDVVWSWAGPSTWPPPRADKGCRERTRRCRHPRRCPSIVRSKCRADAAPQVVEARDSNSRVVSDFLRVVLQQRFHQLVSQLDELRILATVVEFMAT